MKKYIGIDIGGTSIKYGIINENGRILYSNSKKSNINNYNEPLLERLKMTAKTINKLIREEQYQIEGVGVSVTGQIDKITGTVIGSCGNIPGWIGSDIKSTLTDIFKYPIAVENDGNCAAIAEHWIGNGQGYDNLIVYTIGTGIGAGIIINGHIYSGNQGIAGEIGHMIIDMHGKKCTCNNRGCFEQYGSMTSLLHQAQQKGYKIQNGKEFFDRIKYRDDMLDDLLKQFVKSHAIGITNLVHIFNPEAIIIGGGVSKQNNAVINPIREQTIRMLMPAFAENLAIKSAMLDNDAGMIGAVKNYMNLYSVEN